MDDVLIEIREPGRPPRTVPLVGTLDVGRGCDGVNVEDEAASRRHLSLSAVPGGVAVTDLGSSNGTYVNGARMGTEPRIITGADVVIFGSTALRITRRASTPAAAPPPGPPPSAVSASADERAAVYGPVSVTGRLARRLEAAHAWADVETGGVGWDEFVASVVEAGLDDLPAVIARLRSSERSR